MIISGMIIDMDGVLWRGDEVLPGVGDFFQYLRNKKIPFVLATNNTAPGRLCDLAVCLFLLLIHLHAGFLMMMEIINLRPLLMSRLLMSRLRARHLFLVLLAPPALPARHQTSAHGQP